VTAPYTPPAITREGVPADFNLFVCSACGELVHRGESHASAGGVDVCLPCFESRHRDPATGSGGATR